MKDKQIEKLIKSEEARQKKVINLIPSENYVSKDVLTALGSIFDNKYAEGYAHARYYGGQTYTDQLEDLCCARALKLFSLSADKWAVNVQPHSGSPANLAVYLALVPIGGKIMGMALTAGGHLTHGQKVSITGKAWQSVSYGVDSKTEVDELYPLIKNIGADIVNPPQLYPQHGEHYYALFFKDLEGIKYEIVYDAGRDA